MLDQLRQPRRHDLPGKAEFILEPSASSLFASGGELGPIFIHLALRIAAHHEGDRFGEPVKRSAVEGGEPLAVQFESDSENRALRSGGLARRARFAQAA